jgi:glycosyltransferase involved in cell wall biosynthesis
VRIILFAYACEPGEGSEPGAGWAWARMLSNLGEVWVVTRANNRTTIEAGIGELPERDRLRFIFVDLPRWARWWKRGRRGLHVYYLAWQVLALRAARRVHEEAPFDLAWHVTLANAWLGSTAGLLGVPFVYGPVGGGVKVPFRLLPELGVRGAGYEAVRAAIRDLARYLNPLARSAWRRAELILVQNRETRRWLPRRHRHKVAVLPNVVVSGLPPRAPRAREGSSGTAVFAGRLLPWKGASLAIRAVAQIPGWRLLLYGSGPDDARLRSLAVRHGVDDRVGFEGTVPRDRLLEAMRTEADVLLFPSMREEAGWVVGEAASIGLPVICLDRGGPPLLGGRGVRVSWPGRTSEELARMMVAVPWVATITDQVDPSSRLSRISSLLEHTTAFPERHPGHRVPEPGRDATPVGGGP